MITTLNYRPLLLRVLLVVGLCFNYLLVMNLLLHRHPSSFSSEEVSFLDPTRGGMGRVRRRDGRRILLRRESADRRVSSVTSENNDDDAARQDLRDCGIIDGSCNLVDLTWGTPTILISLGRSGSSATWQLMSAMTGNYTFQATEDTGSSTGQSVNIFNNVFNQTLDGKCWIQQLLCIHQDDSRRRMEEGLSMAGLYGFKWKPYFATFGLENSVEALRWLSRNPHVKVVHNRRNPLDVLVSRYKHKDRGVRAHCEVGDNECLALHRNAKPMLPTRKGRLIIILKDLEEESKHADRLLDELHVPHVDVSYEELYFSRDIAVEWRRLFSFLGVGPSDDMLTSSELVAHMEHASTSSLSFREKILNYEEVVETVRGTEYEMYLLE